MPWQQIWKKKPYFRIASSNYGLVPKTKIPEGKALAEEKAITVSEEPRKLQGDLVLEMLRMLQLMSSLVPLATRSDSANEHLADSLG